MSKVIDLDQKKVAFKEWLTEQIEHLNGLDDSARQIILICLDDEGDPLVMSHYGSNSDLVMACEVLKHVLVEDSLL